MVEPLSGYSGPPRSWGQRVLAAARLDVTVYEEVEADQTATWQAAAVVAIAAVAQAIGGSDSALGSIIGSLIAWLIWAGITYLVGVTLFQGTATWGELLRTLGFAQAPGFLYLFGGLPLVGWLIAIVVAIWILIAGIIAIRQALDISTGKAVIVAFVGWLVMIIPLLVFGAAAWFTFGR